MGMPHLPNAHIRAGFQAVAAASPCRCGSPNPNAFSIPGGAYPLHLPLRGERVHAAQQFAFAEFAGNTAILLLYGRYQLTSLGHSFADRRWTAQPDFSDEAFGSAAQGDVDENLDVFDWELW